MCHSHMVIVNDIRQMIRWMAIRLDKNWIFKAVLCMLRLCSFFTFTLANDSVHKISVLEWDVRKLQPDDVCFSLGSTFL